MKKLISFLVAVSIQPCFADGTAPKAAGPESVSTSTMSLETPKSKERNMIILGSGAIGAGIGLLATESLTGNDDKYYQLTMATVGAFVGLAAGTYFGLKFYPPVVAIKEQNGERTPYVNVQLEF